MKRGVKRIVVGSLVMLGAVILAVAIIVPTVLSIKPQPQFLIPGQAEFPVDEPGRYFLWNDYETVFDGRVFNQSEDLPDGIEIRVQDAKTGEPVTLKHGINQTMTTGSTAKKSIGYINVTDPATVLIEVPSSPEERVFSFGRTDVFRLIGGIFAAIGGGLVLGFVGIGLVIWGIIAFATNRAAPAGG